MESRNTIKHWAKDDRPREKLLQIGAEKLSNSELLAILIHNGTKKKSAVDLAKEILQLGDNDITALGKFSITDFMKIGGIGEAKAVTIAAALELGRRRQDNLLAERSRITGSKQVALFLQNKLRDQLREVFAIVLLNQSNKIIHYEIISAGGITGTVADIRIILKKALEKNAVKIILCHNHPSGNLEPSMADERLTKQIKDAASLMDMDVIDHIIVSDTGYYSFVDHGLM